MYNLRVFSGLREFKSPSPHHIFNKSRAREACGTHKYACDGTRQKNPPLNLFSIAYGPSLSGPR